MASRVCAYDARRAREWWGEAEKDVEKKDENDAMNAQSIVWFAIGLAALVSALRVFNRRFLKKDRYAVGSGGGFTMFGVLMLFVAAAAFLTGWLTR